MQAEGYGKESAKFEIGYKSIMVGSAGSAAKTAHSLHSIVAEDVVDMEIKTVAVVGDYRTKASVAVSIIERPFDSEI